MTREVVVPEGGGGGGGEETTVKIIIDDREPGIEDVARVAVREIF